MHPSIGTRIARSTAAAVAVVLAWNTLLLLPASAATTKARSFASADEASQALIAALKAADGKATLAVLGSDAKALLNSGDTVADENGREHFLELYEEKHELQTSGEKAILQVGNDAWPFPIPIVHGAEGWSFDTSAGHEEILDRRIGRNESSAIQASLAYTDAQREYYLRAPEGEPLRYAQKFASSSGKRDGLYWPTKEDEVESPLGPVFAKARSEGYAMKGGGAPFHGYYFRILTAQGADAVGGAYNYVARGKMIGGFALVAYPATYGVSGVMTFMVNHDGVVFQKDLGPKTATAAAAIKTFNPDATWTRVEETVQAQAQ